MGHMRNPELLILLVLDHHLVVHVLEDFVKRTHSFNPDDYENVGDVVENYSGGNSQLACEVDLIGICCGYLYLEQAVEKQAEGNDQHQDR